MLWKGRYRCAVTLSVDFDAETLWSGTFKLLTPSPADFTPDYNAWLESIPNHIRALVFIIKRFYRPEWGDDWVSHFGVDIINGEPGHELKHEGRKLVANYLRIGRDGHGPRRCARPSRHCQPARRATLASRWRRTAGHSSTMTL